MTNIQNLYRTETLGQLILRCRASNRPKLNGLGNDIFIGEDHPQSGKLIKIMGESNTGKSILLFDIIARCILPRNCGGKECEVIFFNCDQKFFMLQFIKVMEKNVTLNWPENQQETENHEKIKNIIEYSLKRLLIYDCYSFEDFEFAILQSFDYIFNNYKVGLIAIDSISTFYWNSDARVDVGFIKMETYYKNILTKLQKICMDYKLCAAYTVSNYFGNKLKITLGDYKFFLAKDEEHDGDLKKIEIKQHGEKYKRFMAINEDGIKIL